jgi:Zn-dependent protease with chaperone function
MQSDHNGLPELRPLRYHWAIVEYLQKEEPELWNWFSSHKVRTEHTDTVRLDLLKSTYRIEPDSQPAPYGLAKEVLAQLRLDVPVTLYQAQNAGSLNAAIAFIPGEAHIILSGPVLNTLSPIEVKAVIGHELAHFLLYHHWDGDFLIAAEVLRALANDAAAHSAHQESARLFALHTEILADRGAYVVTGDALATISTLIKLETGLLEVSAESYLRQADEIFTKSHVQASQWTHPEPYIRARALKLFADQGEEATPEIDRMIEGPPALDRLDLLGQQRVAADTRRLIAALLAPPWFQTEPVLAHARLFFDDFDIGAGHSQDRTLATIAKDADQALCDYYCYVLLDFVAIDADLEEYPLAAALVLSDRLGLGERFAQIASQELALPKKKFARVQRDAGQILAKMNSRAGAS